MQSLYQASQCQTVAELLRLRAQTHPDMTAFSFLKDGETVETSLTYGQLDARARAVAVWLQANGAAGQRVLLLHRPGLEYLAGFFGCLYAGCAAVPAYPPGTPQMQQQLGAIAADARTRLALTDDLVLAHVAATPAAELLQWVSTEQIDSRLAAKWVEPNVRGDALAFLQYTSGSTGTPKGVMVSHANLLHNTAGCHHVMDLRPSDRIVSWLPLYHDMGLITAVIAPLYTGFPSVIMSPDAFLQRPMRWLEAMSRFGATASGSPNFGYDLAVLKSTPAERAAVDLSNWRVAFNGAEAVRAETLGRFVAAFGPAGFRPEAFVAGYGLAEATLIVSAGRHKTGPVVRSVSRSALEQNQVVAVRKGDPDGQHLVGCGKAMPGMQVQIVHPERRTAMPAGAVGEIWVGGPSVAGGYWNRLEATEQAFGGLLATPGAGGPDAGPYLRTGDLGFVDEHGELFITGRIEELIIVRGRNHYPQDIEKSAEAAWIGLMPGAGAAFTVEVAGEERLVVALEIMPDFHGEPAEAIAAVRQAISRGHDLQAHEILLVQPGGLPRTMSGKVQRFGARAAYLSGQLPTLATSGAEVAAGTGAGDYPLSHGQASLWFLYRMAPESAAYNIARAVRVHNHVDAEAFRRALQQLTDRHPALRTTFHDGPIQRVHARREVFFQVEDAPADLQARLEAESLCPFDLERGPLMRIHHFREPGGSTVIHFSMHHIVADLWSLTVFMQELGIIYAAEAAGRKAELPPVAAEYSAHVQAQRTMLEGEGGAALLAYWQERLGGELPVLALPTDRPRPAVQTYAGGARTLTLEADLSGKIQRLGRKHGATPFATLLAVYQTFLHRYTGQEDIIVGSPTAGRSRSELAGVLGYFVNPVALRSRVHGAKPFTQFLTEVKENVTGALAHAAYPFPLLADKLQVARDPSRTPVYQTMFVLQRAHKRQEFNALALGEPGSRFELGGLDTESLPVWQLAATCDLTLFAAEVNGEFRLSLEYNADLFDAATIDRMLLHFRTLLAGVVAAPETPLDQLPLLTDEEREQVLFTWNQTASDYPAASTLAELFELQAAATPDAVAVGPALSYAELNRRANRLAHHLRGLGVGPDVLVGVCLERTPELVVALLAVLKAGGAYLPLDPAYPRERLSFMLADAAVPVLLTAAHLTERLGAHAARVVTDFDLEAASDENPVPLAGPGHLAYVIYTSGSTGRPKGAMIDHRGLVNYLWWAKAAYNVTGGDGAPVHSSVSFDLTVTSLWTPLIAGRRVDLVPEALGIEGLATALQAQGNYSLVKLTPAHVELVSRQMTPAQAARAAGALVIGGEALLPETLAFWRKAAPATALVNEYGPTETVVGCCVYWVKPGEQFRGSIPIGRPIANTALYILDQHRQPVPVGVAGELYIGGDGVCRGYLNRPELTAERFLPDPFRSGGRIYKTGDLARWLPDGNIDYLGRIDEQVKLRGFRIELGEIETALAAHPAVQTAAAVVRSDAAGKRLVAYVVPRADAMVSVGELKAHLRERVPEYMVPSAFVTMAELPLSPNGKVDRKALPAPDTAAEAATAPRTPMEERLAAIWAEVLHVETVSVHDNFFELGGDSILSIQVVARAQQAGLKLTPRDLFQHPTVAGLAEVAVASDAASPAYEQGPVTGPVPLAPIQRWFLDADPVDPHHYNQAVLLEIRQPLAPAVLERALTRLVDHHDALRLRFRRAPGGGWEQSCAAPGEAVTLADDADCLQTSMDLDNGPLLRAALLGESKLLIAIHHLAVDGVSWRILLEDLQMLCQNPDAVLPPKTASYKEWAATQTAGPAPAIAPDPANTVESEAAVILTLNRKETLALLQDAPAAYRLRPDDVLLTALARAFGGDVTVNLEGHGREGDLDLSRTVGWFTAITPVRVSLPAGSTPGADLQSVKEQLRNSQAALTTGAAAISFNYLGRMDTPAACLFAPAAGLNGGGSGLSRSPRQLRRHTFEIDAMVVGDQLELRWSFSRNLHDRKQVEKLAAAFRRELHGLIAHCSAPDAGGFTPSDFPLAGLEQGSLNRVVEALVARQGIPIRQALHEIEEMTACTPLQQEMLDYTLLAPHSGVWAVQLNLGLEGELSRGALAEAWKGLVDRYCPLRSIFVPAPRGRAVRVVWRRGRTPLEFEDWRGAGDVQRKLAAFLQAEREQGFRFMERPPVRCTLIRLGDAAYRLILSFHHALLDGWSTALLLKELFERYASLTAGKPLAVLPGQPYAAYVDWLQHQDPSAAEQYWRDRLGGYNPPAPLGAGPARGPLMAGAHRDFALSPAATAGLTSLARRHGLTLATVVQGAWALLLGGLTGQGDIVWGAVHAGRPAGLDGAESIIGLLMATLPIRAQLAPDAALGAWLQVLQAQMAEAGQHGHVSPVQAARWAGVSLSHPLFESAVFFENYPVDPSLREGRGPLKLADLQFHEQHHYPLSLIAMPGQQLELRVLTHQNRFSAAATAALTQRLADILQAMAAGADMPLRPLLDLARPVDQVALTAGE